VDALENAQVVFKILDELDFLSRVEDRIGDDGAVERFEALAGDPGIFKSAPVGAEVPVGPQESQVGFTYGDVIGSGIVAAAAGGCIEAGRQKLLEILTTLGGEITLKDTHKYIEHNV
jgi:hypothetical protein